MIRSLTRERCERMGRYRRGPEAVLSSPCLAIHPVLRDVDPSRRMMTWESIPSLDDVGIHPVLRDVGHPVLRDVGIHPVLRDVGHPVLRDVGTSIPRWKNYIPPSDRRDRAHPLQDDQVESRFPKITKSRSSKRSRPLQSQLASRDLQVTSR